jgi:cytochrome c
MMKKFLVLPLIVIICYACNNDEKASTAATDKPDTTAAAAADDISKNPDYQKGLALIGTSDCLTCHKVDETSTGPAYRDVANKYTNADTTITMLSEKIIKGGAGHWGQSPMTPHAALSADDAKQMVKYILLLKNK